MDKQTEDVEKLSARIVEWDAQIDLLRYKADNAGSGALSVYLGAITSLERKRDQAALVLQGISPASEDEWGDIKKGSEQTMGEIRTIVSDAITKIN
jgi:hypothetical protein